ncbi:MAG: GNAT family N-acetyltransferase [Planctomycetes bacterium]|nr:GNAT family N-acetyltransferase [Planctomycetota bacterium]
MTTTHRREPTPADPARVEALVAASGFFNPDEVRIARELVEERLQRGLASGYRFLFADAADGALDGYSCFGPVDGTARSWDLFWIAVAPARQRHGLGRALLVATEAEIAALGGGLVWVETGGKALYEPTRRFYERCGYRREAELRDFYAPGDAKVVFVREVPAASSGA